MVTLNEAELDRLQAMADAATPGPWYHCQPFQTVGKSRTIHGTWPAQHVDFVAREPDPPHRSSIVPMHDPESGKRVLSEDMAFIATAREAVPALIAEVRRLRAGIARAIHEDVTIPSSDQNRCFHGGWYTDGTPCCTEEYLTNLLDVERG